VEAAGLTCWSHVVEFSGLTSMVEAEASNSKSSASEAYWRTPVWFWAFWVFATPLLGPLERHLRLH
jgi:hypothetical protein